MANVLVCGGAGYIGSHMVEMLADSQHEPVVLDNLVAGSTRAVPGNVPFVRADISDADIVGETLEKFDIDVVMHFAAYLAVGESVERPLKYYLNNVASTLILLDTMRVHGVRNFVFSSSAAVYGTPEVVPIPEIAPLAPINPYGRTKFMVEQALRDCRRGWGLKSTALRYFNAAGASESGKIGEDHDPETHLIPLVLQVALGQREKIMIFGDDYDTRDGSCVRDYVHVTDLAVAHKRALERLLEGHEGGAYNLGTGSGITVKEIVETCRKVTGHDIPAEIAPRREGDPPALVADSALAAEELDWKPERSDVHHIINTAWNWHKEHPHGYPG
ncbi:MAG: UDP-glucose 4-epimerase GalE [Planctomycetota bacterium]|nr:UDP-glucose 4-epimerase GalE [Planctomycetota bacterium]